MTEKKLTDAAAFVASINNKPDRRNGIKIQYDFVKRKRKSRQSRSKNTL